MAPPLSADLNRRRGADIAFAAIRNAWDMMVWIVIKTPAGGSPPP